MKKITFLLMALILIACGSKEDKVKEEFAEKGTFELMDEIEKDEYTPPDDSKLKEKQIEMYIAVKQEELAYARQAAENLKEKAQKIDKMEQKGKKPGLRDYRTIYEAIGDAADFVTADLRAAKKLGYNAKEFQWVKETIIANNAAIMSDTSKKSASKMYNNMLKNLKQQREAAETEELRKMYDEQIQALSQNVEEINKEEEWAENVNEYNKKLLMKYKDQIQGLDLELKKWRMLSQEGNPDKE